MRNKEEEVFCRKPSYRRCVLCQQDCLFGTKEQPCWGEVTADCLGEETIHACEGHSTFHYRPEPEKRHDQ